MLCTQLINKLRRDERGQNLVVAVLNLVAVVSTIMVLVLDGGWTMAQRRRMQNAADAAAFAGARELALGATVDQVYARSTQYGAMNGADTVETVIDGAVVTARASTTFPTYFAGLVGIDESTVGAVAAASFGAVAELSQSMSQAMVEREISQGIYPLAVQEDNFEFGQTYDIFAGGGPGNFGWLTWDGCNSTPCLCETLTPPGNIENYVNPYDAGDDIVSVGDWVQGKPGVKNASCVRDWLNHFIATDLPITIPIWDVAEGSGANLDYHIVGFAQFIVESYELSGQNRITGRFLEHTVVPSSSITEWGWEDFDDGGWGEIKYTLLGVKLVPVEPTDGE